jgi:chorismate mutase
MTELVMYFGIGFFVATLLGLLIVLRVHHRALRFGSVDQLHADVRQLEQQLVVALAERSRLQREIAWIKRDAETIWAAERVESALLRERINDVAYEVAQITQALERPGSLTELSAYDAAPEIGPGGRSRTPDIHRASAEYSAPTRAPADRIRALRTIVASRAAAN